MNFWLFCLLGAASALPTTTSKPLPRQNTATYDYVVVGCGVSGLVVSNRLTENNGVSVLCIEAGDFDHYEALIQVPFYIGLQPQGFYDWGISTVPQNQLDGHARHIPMGKGVGGGSLINGMVWNRGNQESFNAWNDIGNTGWGWASLLPYFQRSETFTPKTYPGQEIPAAQLNTALHGTQGPVQVSYSNYFWNQSNNWFEALASLGVPTARDPNDGLSAGGYFLPLDIDPNNQTRSDARRAYYDPVAGRPNLQVTANAQVTLINFDTSNGLRATGVQYVQGGQTITVNARREVILAAGAIHSPQLLELSGIGQGSILRPLGINVLEDLPGVGNNLQDHGLMHIEYSYTLPGLLDIETLTANPTLDQQAQQEYYSSKTGPWTAKPSQAVAFPSMHQFIADPTAMLNSITSDNTDYLPANYEDTLRAGYARQRDSIMNELAQADIPAFENLNNNAGGLDLALMRPLTRGTCHITTTDPFTAPAVDPRWLTHPFDFNIMIEAMQFNQRILNTPQIQALQPSYPDISQNAGIEELTNFLRANIGTEYHYSGTTAMLPRNLGGVVNTDLLVYGTSNLRVVDTGIFPMVPGAHLQAVTYAVAERAADIIRGATN